jgi:hypothetical protein
VGVGAGVGVGVGVGAGVGVGVGSTGVLVGLVGAAARFVRAPVLPHPIAKESRRAASNPVPNCVEK